MHASGGLHVDQRVAHARPGVRTMGLMVGAQGLWLRPMRRSRLLGSRASSAGSASLPTPDPDARILIQARALWADLECPWEVGGVARRVPSGERLGWQLSKSVLRGRPRLCKVAASQKVAREVAPGAQSRRCQHGGAHVRTSGGSLVCSAIAAGDGSTPWHGRSMRGLRQQRADAYPELSLRAAAKASHGAVRVACDVEHL